MKSLRETPESFVSGSLDCTLKLWHVQKKQEVQTVKMDDQILCLDVSPNDQWAACGTLKGVILLVELQSGALL